MNGSIAPSDTRSSPLRTFLALVAACLPPVKEVYQHSWIVVALAPLMRAVLGPRSAAAPRARLAAALVPETTASPSAGAQLAAMRHLLLGTFVVRALNRAAARGGAPAAAAAAAAAAALDLSECLLSLLPADAMRCHLPLLLKPIVEALTPPAAASNTSPNSVALSTVRVAAYRLLARVAAADSACDALLAALQPVEPASTVPVVGGQQVLQSGVPAPPAVFAAALRAFVAALLCDLLAATLTACSDASTAEVTMLWKHLPTGSRHLPSAGSAADGAASAWWLDLSQPSAADQAQWRLLELLGRPIPADGVDEAYQQQHRAACKSASDDVPPALAVEANEATRAPLVGLEMVNTLARVGDAWTTLVNEHVLPSLHAIVTGAACTHYRHTLIPSSTRDFAISRDRS